MGGEGPSVKSLETTLIWYESGALYATFSVVFKGRQKGGFPDLDLSFLFCPFFVLFFPFWTFFLSFFVLFGTFPIFPGFSRFARGMVRGFSRFVPSLFLDLLRAPTRTVTKGSATQSGPFPKKVPTVPKGHKHRVTTPENPRKIPRTPAETPQNPRRARSPLRDPCRAL